MRSPFGIPGNLPNLGELLSGRGLRAQLTRALAGVGLLQLLKMVFSLTISVVLARVLGVKDYGTYTYLFSIITLLSLPTYAGLAPLLVREVAFYDREGRYGLLAGIVRYSGRLSVAISTILILGVLAYHLLGGTYPTETLWLLPLGAAATIPLLALLQIRSAVLQGLRKVVAAKLPDMAVRPVVLLTAVGVFALTGSLGVGQAIFCQIFAIAIALLASHLLLRSALPKQVKGIAEDTRRWRGAFLPFSAIALANHLNTELFVPLVGALGSAQEVAYFRVSLSLAILIGIPLVLVETVIHPHVSRFYSEQDIEKIKRLVTGSGLVALFLSLPILASLLLFGKDILVGAYGEEYGAAALPLVILAVGFAVVNVVGPSMQLLYATEFENDALAISLVSLALVGIMSILWIPSHGAVGAAAAFSIARAFRALAFRLWANHRLAQVNARRRPHD